MTTNSQELTKKPDPVSLGEAFIYWLKLGFISFGGPAGQISMMHQELVEKRRWISEHRFLHALNYTMVLPGPEAQQLATYIGWLMHGVRGGIMAGVLFVLPSLFILIGLTWIYLAFGDVPAVEGILYGIKPAVTAIVVFAAYRIGSRALPNNVLRFLAVLAFIAIFALSIPFPYIVLMAGIIGYIGSHVAADKFKAGGHHGSSKDSYGVAIIDDDTPVPEHAKFKWSRLLVFASIGLSIWAAAMALLVINYGWQGTLTQMGIFFTKAALVTFGGAYAVLPYVYQGGVDQFGWLTGTQMIDGLALGETTPGPLIMVVSFVGFVGGWTKEVFGPDALLIAGAAGASIAALFTFLPSFLLILLGGPAVEATRGDVKFTAPLTGITAAVVGVVLNLAVFFAYHVLWPQGFEHAFEWFAALIGAAAFIALFKYKAGIVKVIAASAACGLAYSLIM
ncbi:MAG: chromate efflux transporter [Gammaproteobacteria bacterium]|nr:chromate efflux transporter [Gammaproteobacteria bacterium]MBT3724444.1 chromate efflux transporter [Gammaproteobacteria bacterium]MBT4195614.1 chromate efflux transporter [Gammaproteobacteria bacterium]MBT4450553.1 chromate efflux transporter [Gammaproteobacteria bacterium]MBT4860669.1 chromate efflux transporter [Gammaproteobacteria bacterium]